jgi:hypothetical protein
MSMHQISILLQLLSGVAGGVLAGKYLVKRPWGIGTHAVIGFFGGGLAGQVVGLMGSGGGEADMAKLSYYLLDMVIGTIGGGTLTMLAGLLSKGPVKNK